MAHSRVRKRQEKAQPSLLDARGFLGQPADPATVAVEQEILSFIQELAPTDQVVFAASILHDFSSDQTANLLENAGGPRLTASSIRARRCRVYQRFAEYCGRGGRHG